MSPIRAPNTNNIQLNIQISIAVRPRSKYKYSNYTDCTASPSALGVLVVMLLKMLTSTRNKVTRRAILPGMMSGGTTKLNGQEFYCCFHINVFI